MTYPPPDPWQNPESVPQYGYQVPGGMGVPSPEAGYNPQFDPLVPPPGSLSQAWFDRIKETIRRGFWPLVMVFAVTVALPQFVAAGIGLALGAAVTFAPTDSADVLGSPEVIVPSLVGIVILSIVAIFLNALGWAAAIWTITQQAMGQPAPLGAALQAGLRRALPMFGWYILVALLAAVGFLFCVLPGLYFAVATSLFSFVVMFERGANPIGRSFSLVNSNFGAALGRVLLLVLVYVGVAIAMFCVFGGLTFGAVAAGTGTEVDSTFSAVQVVGELVNVVVTMLLDVMLLVGLFITYTQLRSRSEPLSTQTLWHEINQR